MFEIADNESLEYGFAWMAFGVAGLAIVQLAVNAVRTVYRRNAARKHVQTSLARLTGSARITRSTHSQIQSSIRTYEELFRTDVCCKIYSSAYRLHSMSFRVRMCRMQKLASTDVDGAAAEIEHMDFRLFKMDRQLAKLSLFCADKLVRKALADCEIAHDMVKLLKTVDPGDIERIFSRADSALSLALESMRGLANPLRAIEMSEDVITEVRNIRAKYLLPVPTRSIAP